MSHIDKAKILAALRDRGLHDRADWVDRQLPDEIDTNKNASILRMLRLDDEVLAAASIER
jgi:hypothetical protein